MWKIDYYLRTIKWGVGRQLTALCSLYIHMRHKQMARPCVRAYFPLQRATDFIYSEFIYTHYYILSMEKYMLTRAQIDIGYE